jgi:phage FluMu protein Com
MPELSKIYCICGKLLLEANGEGKKICPKCGEEITFKTKPFGTIISTPKAPPDELVFYNPIKKEILGRIKNIGEPRKEPEKLEMRKF